MISTVFHIYEDSMVSSREDILYSVYFEGDIYPSYSLVFYIFVLVSIPSGPRSPHR